MVAAFLMLVVVWVALYLPSRLTRLGDDADLTGVFLLVYAAVLVYLAGKVLARRSRVGKAARAADWTPLRVTLDYEPPRDKRALTIPGRVWAPDGTQTPVQLLNVTINLAMAAYLSGQLWVIGAPGRGDLLIGLPGYPMLGSARLGPPR
ncbi:hypothetical protein FNH05_18130 [Amycolatopsis rhizosphaerae]|uniref:Uncharacterized protein n=1 Tax=Amycolatopsis rhizosphaerae TaxID=2053003 RepID=A0A558CH69_9PSEU|nr:hypothetical protein [Amycolatopsis rhizosphaerae]TVT48119.1 hypothetical protein FNH05_18130 [Amycolatopsis rhizosphaerae]